MDDLVQLRRKDLQILQDRLAETDLWLQLLIMQHGVRHAYGWRYEMPAEAATILRQLLANHIGVSISTDEDGVFVLDLV